MQLFGVGISSFCGLLRFNILFMAIQSTKDQAHMSAESLLKDYYGAQWHSWVDEKLAGAPYELGRLRI